MPRPGVPTTARPGIPTTTARPISPTTTAPIQTTTCTLARAETEQSAPADLFAPATLPAPAASFDFVKRWPREALLDFALWHMHAEEKRRETNRKYSVTTKGRERQRRYYFTSRDIYHPHLNPAGAQEKRWKRPAAACGEGADPS